MNRIRYTLLADGSSDRLLLTVIGWAIRRKGWLVDRQAWADLSVLNEKPAGLRDRAREAVKLYPCDVLFVHRDAEHLNLDERQQEIRAAVQPLGCCFVCVVPVRMTEAWLLHDEDAIRRASGNPNGNTPLELPNPAHVEALTDPKEVLHAAILAASSLSGRRLKKKKRDLPQMRFRLADLISDFSPLEVVPAFVAFMKELDDALEQLIRAKR